ncbi:hypothetical protein Glove_177g76 [Diversispora epigaea]|uniref:Uncharacterized protein n=1 Tax=Diversispora epigaea TaxID=1348612 RepID=A0A397IXX4_9GLOM|nr:hypothetical protein Glove_177g76 [Diversispora epigaea]
MINRMEELEVELETELEEELKKKIRRDKEDLERELKGLEEKMENEKLKETPSHASKTTSTDAATVLNDMKDESINVMERNKYKIESLNEYRQLASKII